ncbi:MAG: PA14 domain-containing protein [Bradymonadia bacterium]
MKRHLPWLLCSLAACNSTPETPSTEGPATGATGIALRSDILADTDVAGMQYTLTPVDCDTGAPNDPDGVISVTRDLEDILLPGGHPGFQDGPFDAASGHLFTDAFQAVPAGCYDVLAQPIDIDGELSEDCAAASEANVPVQDGEVTEIVLVSQCVGDGSLGAVDAVVALNHPPQLVDAYYDPSKFTCQNTTTLCVVAEDPDNDPMVLTPRAPEGVLITMQVPVVNDLGQLVQCIEVEVPGPGQYPITLTVQDQMVGPEGQLIPIESILDEGILSSDQITMPVHAMSQDACVCDCPEGFTLNAAGDACEQFTQADAVLNGEPLSVCEGDDRDEYGALGAQFPDGLVVQNSFFGDGFDNGDGRLNAIGIWACDGALRQWIGFSTCINVEEEGEYVLGIAGDDQTRIFVDGQLVFEQVGNQQFRTWWMTPIQLSPGPHVIEMEGYDQGVSATLGAEIYGPFPAGSTVDDQTMAGLDYPNNIFWSTGDELGGVFDLGENNGYSCPDGTSLNLCGDAPTCTGYEQVACGE